MPCHCHVLFSVDACCLLVVNDLLGNALAGHLADALELRVLEDLGDVRVPPHLVAFLLAGRQVAANEADARVVQRHAHGDASLVISESDARSVVRFGMHEQERRRARCRPCSRGGP